MSNRPNPALAKRMRALVEELEESGMSLAAFARMKGEPLWRLSKWRRRFEQEAAVAEPAFIPVHVVDAPRQATPLEVTVGRDRRVLVHPGFDEATLQRLVRVLEAC